MVGGRAEGRRRRPTVAIAFRGLREGPRAACARGSQDSGTALAMHASDPRQEREKRRHQRHAPKKCHKRVTAPPPNRRKLVPPLPQPQSPPARQARSQLISGSAMLKEGDRIRISDVEFVFDSGLKSQELPDLFKEAEALEEAQRRKDLGVSFIEF